MKKILFSLFLLLGVHLSSSAQVSVGASSEVRHFVSLEINNLLYFSLEANDNTDVSAQRQLIVNSNLPMNITVKEMTNETFYTYIPQMQESSGPAITQMRSVFKVKYFTDHEVYYAASLLYTAAPM